MDGTKTLELILAMLASWVGRVPLSVAKEALSSEPWIADQAIHRIEARAHGVFDSTFVSTTPAGQALRNQTRSVSQESTAMAPVCMCVRQAFRLTERS